VSLALLLSKLTFIPLDLDYLQGTVKIDEYVTHHRKFAEINEGFHDMHVCTFVECSILEADIILAGRRMHPMCG
jgi:hypothetical protein